MRQVVEVIRHVDFLKAPETGSNELVGRFQLIQDTHESVEIGGHAIHIPYASTWAHENKLDRPLSPDSYYVLEDIGQVPEFIRELVGQGEIDEIAD